jgi:hypothetical protein
MLKIIVKLKEKVQKLKEIILMIMINKLNNKMGKLKMKMIMKMTMIVPYNTKIKALIKIKI